MSRITEISDDFTRNKLDPKLGVKRTEILANPSMHYDFGLIRISDDRLLGTATDDAVFISGLSPDRSSYLTFHKSVGKLVSSGIMPEYFNASIHLPRDLEEDAVAHFWNSINIEAKKFQVGITSGSVSIKREAKEPFVGGTTALGTSRMPFHVTPEMVNDGDRILVTKTAGLEATTLIATLIPEFVEEKIGQYNHKLAQKMFFKTSTIQEAQEALKFGFGNNGVTSMKSAGEKGLTGALYDFAGSGKFGISVDFESIPAYDEVKEICALFDLDPYRTSSMGSMIMTMSADVSEDLIKNLVGNGIDVADIGSVDRNSEMVKFNGMKDTGEENGRAVPVYDIMDEIIKTKS